MQHTDEEWFQLGVDVWMLRENLQLSPEERIRQHQETLDFIYELQRATRRALAKTSATVPKTHPQQT